MKKILIVSFYELKEYFIYISEILKNYMYDIDNYPLFCYAFDNSSKIPNYINHFDEYIKKSNPDVILWWFLDIPENDIKYIVENNKNIYYIMFNNDIKNINIMLKKSIYFNLVISSNDIDNKKYIEFNEKNNDFNAKINHVVYDSILNDNCYYKIEIDYIYDVCIILCCKNETNKQYLDELTIYFNTNNKKYKIIYLFQDTNLVDNEIYINVEKNSNELNKLFNSSKIILCDICGYNTLDICLFQFESKIKNENNENDKFHTCLNKEKFTMEYYIACDKLIYNIMLSGNLLITLCDDNIIKNIDKNIDYIHVDKNDVIFNIDEILNNYENKIKIKKNGQQKMQKLLWNNFGDFLHINISKHFFNAQNYALLHDLNHNVDLWDHWLHNKKNICYEFDVDPDFDYKKFAYDNNLVPSKHKYSQTRFNVLKEVIDNRYLCPNTDHHFQPSSPTVILEHEICLMDTYNKKKLYIEWIQKGKSNIYVKKSIKDTMCEIENMNITVEQWFELNVIFNEIRNIETISSGLIKLDTFQKNNELVDINKMLNTYVKLCDL